MPAALSRHSARSAFDQAARLSYVRANRSRDRRGNVAALQYAPGTLERMLRYSSYVFQRRVLVPPLHALRVATDRGVFNTGAVIAGDERGALVIDAPFRLIDVSPAWRWRAEGRLINARGRTLARVELELGPWSADDCELLLRPRTSRPDRWGTRRLRRYFAHAGRRVDAVQRLLAAPRVVRATPTRVQGTLRSAGGTSISG